MAAKYLVTGGAGFIGTNLVSQLCAGGEKVTIVDNFSTGKKKNLRDLPKDVKVIEEDVLDAKAIRKHVKGHDFVIHLAGQPSVLKSVKDPEESLQTNAMGTLNVLTAARDAKVKRFVHVGSAAAYGESPARCRTSSA